jgi:uncharacterized protein (TIGR03435 family)
MKISALLAILLLAASLTATAQSSPSALSFEVASIKLAEPQPMGRMRVMMNADPGRIHYSNVSLLDCIRVAYDVKEFQISGPDWLGSERFDIQATYPAGATEDQVPEMLRSLLAERFRLQLHRETTEHAVYVLVAGKNGARLKPAEVETSDQPSHSGGPPPEGDARTDQGGGAGKAGGGPVSGGPPRQAMMMMMDPAGMHLKAPAATLGDLCDAISHFTDRPVVDQTGIQGRYDFDLVFTPENKRGLPGSPGGPKPMPMGEAPPGAETRSAEPGPSIFDAVQQYGLRLEPRKAPLTQLIIDHIEKTPTEN